MAKLTKSRISGKEATHGALEAQKYGPLQQTSLGKPASELRWGTYLPMKTATEYRAMAEECFKWAHEAHAAEVRVAHLELAQVWLDAASKLDGPPPTRIPPAPDAA